MSWSLHVTGEHFPIFLMIIVLQVHSLVLVGDTVKVYIFTLSPSFIRVYTNTVVKFCFSMENKVLSAIKYLKSTQKAKFLRSWLRRRVRQHNDATYSTTQRKPTWLWLWSKVRMSLRPTPAVNVNENVKR